MNKKTPKRLIIEIDEDLHSKFKSKASGDGKSMRNVLEFLIKKYIKSNG